jgi:hypothetical protein
MLCAHPDQQMNTIREEMGFVEIREVCLRAATAHLGPFLGNLNQWRALRWLQALTAISKL